ncbi:MAG: alcohol dehydrogenase catalytic domain-containing protein [Bryobacterales bacterium]|nr:alcohol dehydrogenase catalytic domain-containing protein [Bryobacterales bacterium]
MLAVHLEGGRISVRNRAKPRLREGFATIRLLAGGICNTDLELQRGYYGFKGTPGHEFAGEVADCVDQTWIGKRVVGEINLACEKCEWCRRGLGRHCPKRTVLGIVKHPGAFQEYFTLPVRNLFEMPRNVTTEEAVFAEPVAAACEILDQVRIGRGERVAVLGDGKLGLLIAQVMALHGARVILFGRHASKLAIAEAVGAEGRLKPAREKYRVTVEATGSSGGLRQAVGMTQPRGVVIMKSTVHNAVEIDTAPVIVDEITLVGSRCGRFAAALPLLKSGKLNLKPMISDEFALRDAPRAFARANEKGVIKVLLRA